MKTTANPRATRADQYSVADWVAPKNIAGLALFRVFLRAPLDGSVEGVHGGHHTTGWAKSRSARQELINSGRYGIGKVDKYLDVS